MSDEESKSMPKSIPKPEPQAFAPLPDRPQSDRTTAFHDQLTRLVGQFCGVDLPVGHPQTRTWEQNARHTMRKALAEGRQLPEALFGTLLRTAVYDPNPSFNRWFVEPAVNAYGRVRVQTALLDYLRTGSDAERAGAARAWYWTATRKTADQADAALVHAFQQASLREFVTNEDLDVRRCLLPGLWLNPRHYPAELHPLVAEAVRIARTHPDEYIRHRVEVQVG